MEDATRLLIEHPYLILFLAVLAEQIGLPLPGVLFLIAGGSLAAAGNASLGVLLCTGIVATLLADVTWFAAGWHRGRSVVDLIFWLSPSPDGYARRAWRSFLRRGDRVLLWAKFVPGVSTFTPPLAGAARMPLPRFLAFDGAGAALWTGGYLAAGFVLGPEVGRVAGSISGVRGSHGLVLLAVVFVVMAWRHLRARRSTSPALMIPASAHDSRHGW